MKSFKHRFLSFFLAITLLLTGIGYIVPLAMAVETGYTVLTLVITNSSLGVITIKAWPEKRVPKLGGNLDELLRATFKNPNTGEQLLQTAFTSGPLGLKSDIDISSLSAGTYHIFVKGRSHLTKKLSSFALENSTSQVDTTLNESTYLLAGDVNGTTYGDDVINAIDLSIIINDLDTFDLRTDLNRDNTVNALDLSILITNLDKEGDS